MYLLKHILLPPVDVNECATGEHECTCNGLAGCTAQCIDEEGYYSCKCTVGFALDPDGQTCNGEHKGQKIQVQQVVLGGLRTT